MKTLEITVTPKKWRTMKEDNYLIGQVEDKISACDNKYIMTNTGFLDSHQQSVARIFCKKNHVPVWNIAFDGDDNKTILSDGLASIPPVRTLFYGGYEDAERVIMVNMPDYADLERDNPLCIIRATKASGSRELTHRDYLGSLLGLGLKREMVGDIMVRDDGADIIVLAEIADFIDMNYYKAGRTNLSVTQLPISELLLQEHKVTVVTDTVASLRLDSVIASAFGLSRGKSAEAITRGLVFGNNMEITKTDFQLSEGDKLTLRGKGKAVLSEVGGKSRKDRQYITIERY
ncbi:MAG: YlmH/Sll1252 family protein [Clostridia bacterium]|nr:YlmH/Sll1252 family protein [Clostridia bacterium]